jgi:hypothetical protein
METVVSLSVQDVELLAVKNVVVQVNKLQPPTGM